MTSSLSSIVRGAMLGYASGILSQSALATVLVRTPASSLPGPARHAWIKRLVVAATAGEVVANAFVPSLPPRTTAGPLGGRIAFGALAGGLATRGAKSSGLLGAIVGGCAAPVGAWASTTSRRKLAQHMPDKLIALGETVIAFGLSRTATK
jgi:uncharacterized membrane protein